MSRLRVLTYNIEFGRPERLEAVHAVLAAADADLITLNEADHEAVVVELAGRLKMHHVWARGSGDRHVATLSRFPIESWAIYNTKPLTQAALMTRVALGRTGSEPLTIYNVHLRPDPYWHFELLRWLAVKRLQQVIARQPAGPHLLMGDFNTYAPGDPVDVAMMLKHMAAAGRRTLWLQRYRFLRIALRTLLRAGYVDCFRRLHPHRPGFTFTRNGIPVNRMDYILADPVLAPCLRRCDVPAPSLQRAAASDHFPLLADFEL